MLNPIGALRATDDLLGRAMTQLDTGERTAARHLLARAGREFDAFNTHPSYLTTRSRDSEYVGNLSLANMAIATVELEAGRPNAAFDAMQSARFLIDLLLPG